jgi:CYTH domain-containing protein
MGVLTNQQPVPYERHFLFICEGVEVRIQRKSDKFEFERKVESNDLTRVGEKFEITEAEFNHFTQYAVGSIVRESYILEGVSIKVYKGKHSGLIRAEVEFNSEEEASKFEPLDWFGKEITDSPLGKDKKLSQLSVDEFKQLLERQ